MHRRKRSLSFFLFIFFSLFLWRTSLHAQEPLTAEIDRSTLSTDDTLTLTVTIDGGNATPTLPPLADFQIVGSSSATSISIINGAMSSQATYRYTLHPLRSGELTIGSITATIDNQTYATEPLTVQVTAGTAPPANSAAPVTPPDDLAGQDFFVEAEVDKTEPYLGEQVVYTFRFYQGSQLLGQPLYERPEFTGFWSQETAQQDQQLAQVPGADGALRTYRVATLQTILFPTVPGVQTIDTARLELPGSFGRSGLNLLTDEITVTVRPLPQPAPAAFNGAVGEFTLAATLDKTSAAVNDSLTLHVTLSGAGSLETIPDPVWPDLPGWRAFDDAETTNTHTESNGLDGLPIFSGSKEYERILIPGQPGQFTIPAIAYVYFNPAREQYETAVTDPIPVTVTGAADVVTAVPTAAPVETTPAETVTRPSALMDNLPAVLLYAALALFLFLLLATGWQWRRQRLAVDQAAVRRAQAGKRAHQALRQARQTGADPYAVSTQVILTYLKDKLGQPVVGLTRSALAALLAETAVTESAAAQLLALLDQSDLARFAPGSQQGGDDLLAATEQLINHLEQEIQLV
ncbi:MAG: protein BatD [Anaerolineales bacterium]|nr:protein BatD [Anaerolineales bacterium]